MQFYDDSPRRQVLIRLEYPIYDFLKKEAAYNNLTVTQLVRHYFAEGFGRKRADIILEKARKNAQELNK